MEKGHPLEQSMGMEYYSLDIPGIGGRLKKSREDFVVQEITPNGTLLDLRPWTEPHHTEPLGEQNRFVTLSVQKAGLSTLDAVMILAAGLKLPHHLVTYAGLKDKRAVTVQRMSIPASAAAKMKDLEVSRILISSPQYERHPVQIGDLWGNHFVIKLRDIDHPCNEVIEFLHPLGHQPLLNYFGIQRFGLVRPPSHLIGRAIVKQDYEDAVRIMLTTTSEYEADQLTEIRNHLKSDFTMSESVLEAFPQDMRNERIVIKHLVKHPADYEGAVTRMNSRVQTLLVHSYQSYLFNCLISERAKAGFPLDAALPGDFLIQLDETHSGRDSWRYVTERNIDEVTHLIASGKYGLACAVPGYATKTPSSRQTEILTVLLRREGIQLSNFRNKQHRALDSSGGLHLASLRPSNFMVKCLDNDIQLSFSLRKGSYATIVLREVMRNHPLNRM